MSEVLLMFCFMSFEIIIVRFNRSTFLRLLPNLYSVKTCNTYVFSHFHGFVAQATLEHLNTRAFTYIRNKLLIATCKRIGF